MSNHTITAQECRHVVHIPARNGLPDVHFIKMAHHLSDGSVVPAVRLLKNYKRPVWFAKPQHRSYTQKKEWEKLEHLNQVECTQSDLRDTIAKALDRAWSNERIKQLNTSPYVYGADISSAACIKRQFQVKYPDAVSPYSVATLDIETNVVTGTTAIEMITVTYKATDHLKVYTVVSKDFVAGFSNVFERVKSKMQEYLGEYIERLNIIDELEIGDTEIELIEKTFAKLHEWKPDFLAIWNMDYDIPKIITACENAGVHPKDIFCDPIVPKPLRFFKYRQGKKKKVTASGKVVPINPADQWHVVDCPSSFFIIDAMCVYRQIRLAKQAEPSYSLDAILNKELGIRKLKFEAADSYIGLRWHQFMQTEFKIEYIIYNRFDCISMVELETKIKDLSYTLPSFSDTTEFSRFNSQPKKIADAMHWFLLERGYVQGTVGAAETPEGEDGDDEEVEDDILGLDNWIITLPAHLMTEEGLRCIEEDPTLRTNIRGFVADSDAVSSYPSDISALNVSKETTRREIIGMEGVSEEIFRLQNINIVTGPINAIEYCTTMFNFPKPEELLEHFQKQ